MIFHITRLIPFWKFRNKVFFWLKIYHIYMNMTNYHNRKDVITKIFHITKIDPTKYYRNIYEENLNEVFDIMVYEVTDEDTPYFAICRATMKYSRQQK